MTEGPTTPTSPTSGDTADAPASTGAPASGRAEAAPERQGPLETLWMVAGDGERPQPIATILSEAGFQVLVVTAWVELSAVLRASETACGLILVPHPALSASDREVVDELTRHRPNTHFFLLADQPERQDVLWWWRHGAVDLLRAPVEERPLVKAIGRALERVHRQRELAPAAFEVQSDVRGWIELAAPTDFEYVERFQAFVTRMEDLPFDGQTRQDLCLAVEELGQNAIEWGNQRDREKRIRLSYCLFEDRVVFKIADEGTGFDPGVVPDPTADPIAHVMRRQNEGKRPGGYGIYLVRRVMDDVTFSDRGNAVLMTKRFDSATPGSA